MMAGLHFMHGKMLLWIAGCDSKQGKAQLEQSIWPQADLVPLQHMCNTHLDSHMKIQTATQKKKKS